MEIGRVPYLRGLIEKDLLHILQVQRPLVYVLFQLPAHVNLVDISKILFS
jgi:hypothetical protein